jgi:hypothetical protein
MTWQIMDTAPLLAQSQLRRHGELPLERALDGAAEWLQSREPILLREFLFQLAGGESRRAGRRTNWFVDSILWLLSLHV